MSFTPYDWNQSLQTRSEYIEERLREGSPAVGLSLPDGILIASIHNSRRKVFEIYDRLMFSGIGHASDVEAVRTAAIDFAHQEGFQRSPEDVTLFRLVGSTLSPALKQAFGDPFTAPAIVRALFAEMHEEPEDDQFYALHYDGEYRSENRYSVIAGAVEAENRMIEMIHERIDEIEDRTTALKLALDVWALGRRDSMHPPSRSEDNGGSGRPDPSEVLREALRDGRLEAGWMERRTSRERKFRLLRDDELQPVLDQVRSGAD